MYLKYSIHLNEPRDDLWEHLNEALFGQPVDDFGEHLDGSQVDGVICRLDDGA